MEGTVGVDVGLDVGEMPLRHIRGRPLREPAEFDQLFRRELSHSQIGRTQLERQLRVVGIVGRVGIDRAHHMAALRIADHQIVGDQPGQGIEDR